MIVAYDSTCFEDTQQGKTGNIKHTRKRRNTCPKIGKGKTKDSTVCDLVDNIKLSKKCTNFWWIILLYNFVTLCKEKPVCQKKKRSYLNKQKSVHKYRTRWQSHFQLYNIDINDLANRIKEDNLELCLLCQKKLASLNHLLGIIVENFQIWL